MHPRNRRNVELEPVDVFLKTLDGVFQVDIRPVGDRDTAEVSVGIVSIGTGLPGGYSIIETVVLDNDELVVGRLVLLYSKEASGKVETVFSKSTWVARGRQWVHSRGIDHTRLGSGAEHRDLSEVF